jgi:hypothetical protein
MATTKTRIAKSSFRLIGALIRAAALMAVLAAPWASCARYVGADDKFIYSSETLAKFDRFELVEPHAGAELILTEYDFQHKAATCALKLGFWATARFEADEPFEGNRHTIESWVEWNWFWDGCLAKLWLFVPANTIAAFPLIINPVVLTMTNPAGDLLWRLCGYSGADWANGLFFYGLGFPGMPDELPSYGQNWVNWTAWFNPAHALLGHHQKKETIYIGPIKNGQREGFPQPTTVTIEYWKKAEGLQRRSGQNIEKFSWKNNQYKFPEGSKVINIENVFWCKALKLQEPDFTKPIKVTIKSLAPHNGAELVYEAIFDFRDADPAKAAATINNPGKKSRQQRFIAGRVEPLRRVEAP